MNANNNNNNNIHLSLTNVIYSTITIAVIVYFYYYYYYYYWDIYFLSHNTGGTQTLFFDSDYLAKWQLQQGSCSLISEG